MHAEDVPVVFKFAAKHHAPARHVNRRRHFGFLGNRLRTSRLALGRQLLASGGSTEQEVRTRDLRSKSSSLRHCPCCGAAMIVMQRFTAAELSLSPTSILRSRGPTTAHRMCSSTPTHPYAHSLPTRPPATSVRLRATACEPVNHRHAAFLIRCCSPTPRLGGQLAFKSHSAPRPPQNPAPSS
jgi:hypothetical protein